MTLRGLLPTLDVMEQPRTPAGQSSIDDLFKLTLADGLPVTADGKIIRYKVVRLRETGVSHERAALRQAERVMVVAGVPKLLISDADFRFALTAQHIEAFECDGIKIAGALIDLETVGKLSSHDLGLIEQRVFLITLAAEVRYGNISQDEFDAVVSGKPPASAPQPGGQIPDVGAPAASPESGPSLLADFTGGNAPGAPSGDGR